MCPSTTHNVLYDDDSSEIFYFFTWNRCFQESFSQRNWFPQGIDSVVESMPGVIESFKILALTYAGEVAVELSAHTLQEQNTRIHVTQLLLNPQLPINNFDQGFLLVFCTICGFRQTFLFCPGHFVASKGGLSSTVWPPPPRITDKKRKSNFPHI